MIAGIEDAWSSYLSALESDPLLVKSITAGIILGAADLSGQAIQSTLAANDESGTAESSDGVDIARFILKCVSALQIYCSFAKRI